MLSNGRATGIVLLPGACPGTHNLFIASDHVVLDRSFRKQRQDMEICYISGEFSVVR